MVRTTNLINTLDSFYEISDDFIIQKPAPNAWCMLEVARHMTIAHNVYIPKIESAFDRLKLSNEEITSIRSTVVPSMLIKRFPPKDGKIKYRIKTSSMFEPDLDLETVTSTDIKRILNELNETLVQLRSWIEQYQKVDFQSVRFNSAIGPIVRFNIAEACEFILCHNERHFQQMENIRRSM